ncbi:MAG: helix-turn-helix transcriptional regulator [Dehalococcoidales bacterium]|nr:helix-turn-helix transcriptional regulator [Dehalococcoidales bacterium]
MLDDDYHLSPRELEAATLVAQGYGLKAVGRQMRVTYYSAKHTLERARRKADAPTNAALVYRLMRKGLIR